MKLYTLQTVGKRLQELLDENARLLQRIAELEARPGYTEVDCPNCGKTVTVEEE